MIFTRRYLFKILGLPVTLGSSTVARSDEPPPFRGALRTLNSVVGPGGLIRSPIPLDTSAVLVRGYAAPEDQGRAVWVRCSGAGSGRRCSADGQWWTISMPVITPQMFGASGQGDGDVANVSAFIEWAKGLGDANGFVPPGTYNLDSATLGGGGLALPTGALISGAKHMSKVVVTGEAPCRLFRATDVANITLEGLWLVGNSAASGSGDGYALTLLQTAAAKAAGSGYRIQDCQFDNFGADNWLSFTNNNRTHNLSAVEVLDNSFNSFLGNARGPHKITIPSHCIAVGGVGEALGIVDNIRVSGNVAHCRYIKGFCIVWSGVSNCVISKNIVRDAGMDASFKDDTACYAFLKYDILHSLPSIVHFLGNEVHGVRDCGIYVADSGVVTIDGFFCSGQSSRLNDTLPKGAIALNGVGLALIKNITLRDCHLGLSLDGQTLGSRLIVDGANTADCDNAILLRTGVRWDRVTIDRWTSESASAIATALSIEVLPSGGIDFLTVSNMDIGGGAYSIRSTIVGGPPKGRRWQFGGGVHRGGISLTNLPFPVVLDKIVYRCGNGPPNGIALDIRGSSVLTIFDQDIVSIPRGGHGYAGHLAQGTIPGRMTFPSGVTLETAILQDARTNILGQHAPTFQARAGSVVHNVTPRATGAVSRVSRVEGWRNDGGGTAWRAFRLPLNPTGAQPANPSRRI